MAAAAKLNKIKESILGKRYDLSFAIIAPAAMWRAMKYKKMSTSEVSNVLSFPLSKTSGEILICKKAAKPFSLHYLFIHGCLHLKGFKHSATMESEERKVMARFALNKWQKSSQESMSARTTSRSSSPSTRATRAKRRVSSVRVMRRAAGSNRATSSRSRRSAAR